MDESTVLHDQFLATKFFIPSFPHALILRHRLIELLTKKSKEGVELVGFRAKSEH